MSSPKAAPARQHRTPCHAGGALEPRPRRGEPAQRRQLVRPQNAGRQGVLLPKRSEARLAGTKIRGCRRREPQRIRGARGGAGGRVGAGGHAPVRARRAHRPRRLAARAGRADRGRAVRAPCRSRRQSRPGPDPRRQRREGVRHAPALSRHGAGRAVAHTAAAQSAPGRDRTDDDAARATASAARESKRTGSPKESWRNPSCGTRASRTRLSP
jgi:hypothetical protein